MHGYKHEDLIHQICYVINTSMEAMMVLLNCIFFGHGL